MPRLYLANYGVLPILARPFWNMRKYFCQYPNGECSYVKDFYNKITKLHVNDISVCCVFSGKYIRNHKFEGNQFINSNLTITTDSYKIEEICNYSSYIGSNYLKFQYLFTICKPELNENKADVSDLSLKEKLELSCELTYNKEISNNFHSVLTPKTQELLNNIKQIIEENKNNTKIE